MRALLVVRTGYCVSVATPLGAKSSARVSWATFACCQVVSLICTRINQSTHAVGVFAQACSLPFLCFQVRSRYHPPVAVQAYLILLGRGGRLYNRHLFVDCRAVCSASRGVMATSLVSPSWLHSRSDINMLPSRPANTAWHLHTLTC